MRRIGVICMVLSFVCTLIGCSGRRAEPWQSMTYHVTSSVLTEGCHFALIRDADGGMSVSGYCFEGDKEYRVGEAKAISQETVDAIEAMKPETAATARQKPFGMADGRQITVTLGFPDGSERELSLPAEQRAQLRELLQKELIGK